MHTHTHSNIRCDVRLSRVVAGGGDAYVDVITYEHTQPDTWDREALLPGIFCDKEEHKKRSKHFLSVEASDSRNEFVPFAVNEYGGIGPQAEAFIDFILTISPDLVALKTYVMRRIAAVTAEHVHRQLHGRVKGHAVVRPAAERAADESRGGTVTDDVTDRGQSTLRMRVTSWPWKTARESACCGAARATAAAAAAWQTAAWGATKECPDAAPDLKKRCG